MRTSRFTADEVFAFLNQAQHGVSVREICVRAGISEATFYNWKTQYEGLNARGVRLVRQLEHENSRLRSVLSLREIEIDVLRAERCEPKVSG